MFKTILGCLPLFAIGAEDFISHFEYGQMLYENPRGVACEKCHGHKGEGGVISRYKDSNGKIRLLRAPAIYTLTFSQFYRPFTSEGHRRKDLMPTYHLTREEVRAIYDYLKTVNQSEEKAIHDE